MQQLRHDEVLPGFPRGLIDVVYGVTRFCGSPHQLLCKNQESLPGRFRHGPRILSQGGHSSVDARVGCSL